MMENFTAPTMRRRKMLVTVSPLAKDDPYFLTHGVYVQGPGEMRVGACLCWSEQEAEWIAHALRETYGPETVPA